MNEKQRKILEQATKTKLKNETILTGGSKYINPIRKQAKKKPSFWESIFGKTNKK